LASREGRQAVSGWTWHLELSRVVPEHGVHEEYGSDGVQGSAGKDSALALNSSLCTQPAQTRVDGMLRKSIHVSTKS
jgi:hypothetical protein